MPRAAVRLTFDTNCFVALDEHREPEASCIRKLLELHEAGQVEVRMVAGSASEKQRDKTYLSDFNAFQRRLAKLGLAHVELLKPLAYWGVAFYAWGRLRWVARPRGSTSRYMRPCSHLNPSACRSVSIRQGPTMSPASSRQSGATASATFSPSGATCTTEATSS
jgi:hypothetical protein